MASSGPFTLIGLSSWGFFFPLINASSVEVSCNHLFQLLIQSLILLYKIPKLPLQPYENTTSDSRIHFFLKAGSASGVMKATWALFSPYLCLITHMDHCKLWWPWKKQKQTSLAIKSTSVNLTFLNSNVKGKLFHIRY